jgi:hypothetical protein
LEFLEAALSDRVSDGWLSFMHECMGGQSHVSSITPLPLAPSCGMECQFATKQTFMHEGRRAVVVARWPIVAGLQSVNTPSATRFLVGGVKRRVKSCALRE